MKKTPLADVLDAYPKHKTNIKIRVLRQLLKRPMPVEYLSWGLAQLAGLKSRIHQAKFKLPSSARDDIDDGRYDYGLSQPDPDIKVTCELNIKIPIRGGIHLRADIHRPNMPGEYPVIMAMAPYPRTMVANPGVDDLSGAGTDYLRFEQANPEYWVPRGYIYISVSNPGYGGSGGDTEFMSQQEAEAYYDAIEWAAAQPWSNQHIGLYGISYYAMSQYWVASLKPPHLKAIIPWEGVADPYREIYYRGGIPGVFGVGLFGTGMRVLSNRVWSSPDYAALASDNPLFNEVWKDRTIPNPEDIDIPMLSVGCLNDPDLHLRGNVNIFKAVKNKKKKLLLYSGTHWGSAYQPWASRVVLRFLDHYLKGVDTGIEDEPAIDVQLRTDTQAFTHLYSDVWPLPETQWTRFYLDASNQSLRNEQPCEVSSASVEWVEDPLEGDADRIVFRSAPLEEDVAIAGPVAAHLWVSSASQDVDLTVELDVIDEQGNTQRFDWAMPGAAEQPVTRGWLRASMRALCPDRSTPHEPFYTFSSNEWLTPGKPVELDIELWPTTLVFKKGHRIVLKIISGPHNRYGEALGQYRLKPAGEQKFLKLAQFQSLPSESGETKVHTGEGYPSWLTLPVIPANSTAKHKIEISDSQFTPNHVQAEMGDRLEWLNKGSDYHSVTATPCKLWDSQLLRGGRSHNPETWWTEIPWAGTYHYQDMVSGFKGTIAIASRIHQPLDSKSGFTVELACKAPPEGFGFDVQLQRNGEEWENIYSGVKHTRVEIEAEPKPNDDWAVRSRIRKLTEEDSASASAWSPPCHRSFALDKQESPQQPVGV